MKNYFRRAIQNFKTEQTGSLSVEAVFAFPMLFWAATAMFTFFDAYKVQNASYRANYTISDMLSRETEPVNQAYINGLHKVFRFMTHSGPENSWMRVSVVTCLSSCDHEVNRELEFEWSATADSFVGSDPHPLGASDIAFYKPMIPLMATGNRLILVETSRNYHPPFSVALTSFKQRDLVSHVVTRPRFAANFCWETCVVGGGDDGGDGGNV